MKFKNSIKTSRLLWKRIQYLYIKNSCALNTSLSSTFNRKPVRKFNFLFKEKKNEGLFNIPELTSPEGFQVLEQKSIAEVNTLMAEACDPHRKRKMVAIFDDMSDSLCRVADMVEFLRVSHPDPEYRYSAEKTYLKMSEIVEMMNTNTDMYEALKRTVDDGDILPLTDVDERVAKLFKIDFEKSGIHVQEEQRMQFVQINNALIRICNNFLHAIQQPTPHMSIQKMDFNDEELRKTVTKMSKFHNSGKNITSCLLPDHQVEIVREAAYKVFLKKNEDSEQLLHRMLEARHVIANLVGFKSFAHRSLKGTLAESPENARQFLETLAENIREGADMEYSVLEQMKLKEHQINPLAARSKVLMPWDGSYYSNMCRQKMFKNNNFRRYFSLGACMDGLSMLFEKLFGVQLDPIDLAPGEVWNNDIYKLAVVHKTEGVLGFIYCDFFERDNKPNQDCHFTIQGGRLKADGEYQLPIVVLHLNFKSPTYGPMLLWPAQVETLFHEFGHAMHSMLGRTQYQHVTGTRCPIDFGEVPSVLMEYFASDPRVVQSFAKDYVTGKPLEGPELANFCKSKGLFLYSDLQTQVLYSLVDLEYHGPDFFHKKKTSTEVFKELQNKYHGLPVIENTAPQLRFSHLVGYGGKYYSYLMSRAVASRIWSQLFMKDPFCRENGEKYRQELLAHGGEHHPKDLIYGLLGEEPTIDMLTQSLTEDLERRSVLPNPH